MIIRIPTDTEIDKLAQDLYHSEPEEDFDPEEGYTERTWAEQGPRQQGYRDMARKVLCDQAYWEATANIDADLEAVEVRLNARVNAACVRILAFAGLALGRECEAGEVERPFQTSLTVQRVLVSNGRGEEVEGFVFRGTPIDESAFDLDAPFTIVTDEGERYRITNPWACDIQNVA